MTAWVRTAIVVSIALEIVSGARVWAQARATAGDLIVTVADETGARLPNASVSVVSADTGLTRTGTTNGAGRLSVPALPIGRYAVRAELAGHRPAGVEAVAVSLGSIAELTIALHASAVEVTIDVAGTAPLVDVQRTAVAAAIGERQIADLPIDRRDYIAFALLAAGVSSDRTPSQGPVESSGLSFAGQSARANNITVDGVDDNDEAVGGVRAVFGQDAVREFQVLVNSYSAEFGKAAGGVVNIVTRSGTNRVEGGLFEYFRDKTLNSRGHFDDVDPSGRRIERPEPGRGTKAPFRQHQFGATLGGPLRKNRSFGFFSFERLVADQSNAVTIDDSTIVMHPFLPIALGTPVEILRAAGFPVETGNVPFASRSTTFIGKIDQVVTGATALSVRFNSGVGLNENSQPWGGIVARSRGGVRDNTDYTGAASLTSVHGSRLVHELRGQVSYRDQIVRSLDCNGVCATANDGGPRVELPGLASVGRFNTLPQPRRAVRYEILETVGYDVGGHRLKAGADFNIVDYRVAALHFTFGGQYVFIDIPPPLAAAFGLPGPLSAIQALAIGRPVAYIRGYGDSSSPLNVNDLSAFVQDDWVVGRRLTLRLGARYQRQFWPDHPYSEPGVPGTYQLPVSNNVAPRIGAAWDPRGGGRESITASYGLFFANQFFVPIAAPQTVNGRKVRAVIVQGPLAVTAWQSPGHQLPTSALTPFPSLILSVDPSFDTPFTHHASIGFNRQFGHQIALSVSGVLAKGQDYVGALDYNPTLPDLGPNRRPLDVDGVAGTSASVSQSTAWGESWYRGLLVSVDKRLSRGVQGTLAYTLSKSEDLISDFLNSPPQNQGRGRNPADPAGLPLGFDPMAERGPSLQDQRHRLVASGLYELPGQFQLAGIVTIGSGRPFNIVAGADLNGDGDAAVNPGPDRPRRVPADPSTSIGRNAGLFPAEKRVDLRLSKRVPLHGRAALTATVDVLNAFNTTNYTDINRVFGAGAYPSQPLPTYGQFTQAAPPRQTQIGLRFTF